MTQPANSTEGRDVLISLARLEAKLDVALAQHGAKLDQLTRCTEDHEDRLRKVEDRPVVAAEDVLDHETRLRELERTPTVSPRTLWTVGIGAVGAVTALVPLLERLYN
jgi:hypothetical protein